MEQPNVSGNILLADDNPENLNVLSRILEEQGYEIRIATDGKQVLRSAQALRPDLFLLDIHMPVMDGYQTCKELKANPDLSDIPVIFVSALAETFNKIQAFKIGGADYITKPFEAREVIARVDAHIRAARYEHRLKSDLQGSQERYRRLVESLQREYMFYSYGTDGVFTYVSPSVRPILGYSQQDFLGHYSKYLTDSESNQDVDKRTAAALRGESQKPYIVEMQHKEGALVCLEVVEHPVVDDEQNIIAIEGIAHDITSRKKLDAELAKHRENLEQLVQSRTEELEAANESLTAQKNELEAFNQSMLNREMTVIELKEVINRLNIELGRKPPYEPVWNQNKRAES